MNAGRQVPAAPPPFETQFFEQQSPAPTVQASKSDLQPLPPGSAAQTLPVQRPVQHSVPAPQEVPVCLQVPPSHTPAVHLSEQHSPAEPQLPPAGLQNAAVVQVAAPAGPLHIAEQQSVPMVQESPAPAHDTVGDTQVWLVGSQSPEQHSCEVAQVAARSLQSVTGTVQTLFAQEFVQQSLIEVQALPAGEQVAVETHWFPAQPSDSPAQQSAGTEQDPPECEQAGTWQVRVAPPAGQRRPMQQSPSVRQGALALPQVGGGVQVPFVHESEPLQQGTVGEQVPFVAPQVVGGTQAAGAVPAPSGSTQESAPLQQPTVPEQTSLVAAQVAGAVQTLFVHESAPLQQGTSGGEQVAPVPAQTAGAVHFRGAPVQVSAGLQQLASEVQVEPVPLHRVGTVQTLLPTAPAQAPTAPLQHSESVTHGEPVPTQDEGTVHVSAAQTSVAPQHGSEAQDAPVAAQVGGGGGGGGGLEPLDFPVHAPSSRAAATTRTLNAGRAARDMVFSPG